ncbi:MAG: hypothetical protein KDC24_14535, partial [Saprospiraceae bacterium]|nr:hypothetical protein [Saprospiraceae bacterium]
MKSAFSLCLLTFLSFSAFAQNVFVPALVFVDNDTLDGLVMRPSTTKGKDLIFFTEFEGGPSLSFKADEIEGYKVKGKSRFLSAVVEMNLASIGEPNK